MTHTLNSVQPLVATENFELGTPENPIRLQDETNSLAVVKIVFKKVLEFAAKSNINLPIKAVAVIGALAGALILTACAIVIVIMTFFYHLFAMPFLLTSWTTNGAKSYVSSSFDELFALSVKIMTLPIPATLFESETDTKEVHAQASVVAVHGFCDNSSAWFDIIEKAKLENETDNREKIGTIYSLDLGSPFKSIPQYAEILAKKVEETKRKSGRNDVHLIGHSMGGLVIQYYTLFLAKEKGTIVKSITTLGTPHQGTKIASIAWGECTTDMMPNSNIIARINNAMKDSLVPVFAVGSPTDAVVRPTNSAYPLSRKGVTCYTLDIGHLSFVYSTGCTDLFIKIYRDIEYQKKVEESVKVNEL